MVVVANVTACWASVYDLVCS